ncbi:MAG: multidrug resistance efflux pump [Flammeovirgaceae bacterium]|jgi:multidrug resistance efflux pump
MLKISKNTDEKTIYEQKLNSVKVLQTPKAGRMVTNIFLVLLGLCVVILFLPWQQNIRGVGALTALSPSDRPQTVQTAIAGRISEWRVSEGQVVKKGDTLAVIEEIKDKYFDPNLLDRLGEQVGAKEQSIEAKQAKVNALSTQIATLQAGLQLKLQQLRNKVEQKRLKVTSDSATLEAKKVDLSIAQRQMQGAQAMYDSGLISMVKWEKARNVIQKAEATLTGYENKLNSSRQELLISKLDLQTIRAEVNGKVAKSMSDRSNTISELQDSKGDLAKKQNELVNVEVRKQNYFIRAPQDGFIVKALKQGVGETLKEGEAILTIMPKNPALAAAIYVKAMDIPLIDKGRHVRLQFDGWPAIQFSGWPSVSVGTFGGVVRVIDQIDSKKGKYRILITEDLTQDEEDQPWPAKLRLGSGIYAWVMLDEVPVWYEIWRQLNGFPPTVESYEAEEMSKKEEHKKNKGK